MYWRMGFIFCGKHPLLTRIQVTWALLLAFCLTGNFNHYVSIFRNYDNVPLVASCEFVSYTVKIAGGVIDKVKYTITLSLFLI